jgi:hypothetical protein
VETACLVMSAFWALCQIVATVVLVTVNRRAADGRIPRNPSTGLRTAATMRSDRAWVAGHRAALRLTPLYLLVLAGTLIALLVALLCTRASWFAWSPLRWPASIAPSMSTRTGHSSYPARVRTVRRSP